MFRGNSSSELNFIFIYFLSKNIAIDLISYWPILAIDLIKSLILLHSSSYFLIFSMLSFQRQVLIFINFFKASIHFAENKVQNIYSISFDIFQIFYCYISNKVNKKILAWVFINFNIILYQQKSIRSSFCIYIFVFIAHFLFILLIHNFF